VHCVGTMDSTVISICKGSAVTIDALIVDETKNDILDGLPIDVVMLASASEWISSQESWIQRIIVTVSSSMISSIILYEPSLGLVVDLLDCFASRVRFVARCIIGYSKVPMFTDDFGFRLEYTQKLDCLYRTCV
jgi:hypothetical protein